MVTLCVCCLFGQSGNVRYVVLWSEPLHGSKNARIELFSDEKSFRKQKSPRRTILIADMSAVYGAEPVTQGMHAFSIVLKSCERILFLTQEAEDKEQWHSILTEFVNRRPNGARIGYGKYRLGLSSWPVAFALHS